MRIAVIIAAAGGSTRFLASGGLRHKLDEDLGGKSVLQRAIETFSKADRVEWIIVAGPQDPSDLAAFRQRHGDRLSLMGARLIAGGAHRAQSVANALREVPAEATHVAVHDAARPCTPVTLIEAVFDAARAHGAAIPGIPCGDTLKAVRQTDQPALPADDPVAAILGVDPSAGERLRVVERTVPRDGVWQIQTPQVFEVGLLRRAYAGEIDQATDDASLVERLGEPVAVVRGDPRNLKITTAEDLALARLVLGVAAPSSSSAARRF